MPPSHFQSRLWIRETTGNNPLTPPPGYIFKGLNGATRGPEIIIASSITITVAFIAVVLRIFVKLVITKASGWDDYTCVLALLFAIARVVDNFILVDRYEMGHHIWDVNPSVFNPSLVTYKVGYLFYLVAVMFAKISILLLYLRIFNVNKRFRYLCYTLMVIVVGYCTSLTLAIIFECQPTESGWSFSSGKCVSLPDIDFSIGGFNIFTDSAILVLPIPLLWGLSISTARLIGLLAIFATGLLVVCTSIVREIFVVLTLNTFDTNWSSVDDIVWLTVEVNVGILCSCFPLFPPLFRNTFLINYVTRQYHSLVTLLYRSGPSSREELDNENQHGSNQGTKWGLRLGGSSQDGFIELQPHAGDSKSKTSTSANASSGSVIEG